MPSSSTRPVAPGTILARWCAIGLAEQTQFSNQGTT